MKKLLMMLLAGAMLFVCSDAMAGKKKSKSKKAPAKAAKVAKVAWKTDIKAALKEAQKGKKQILVLLTGSDWCGYCIKLDKAVFQDKAFAALTRNMVLVKADFPRQKKLSPELTKQAKQVMAMFPARGFPTVYLLDSTGKVLDKQVGFSGGNAKSYLKKFKGYKAPKKRK